MTRYARQMQMPEVGAQGQDRLAASHVVVVGAGGLGCPVLQYLTGAGVGRLSIYDPDVVEESNLHRQPLYDMGDLGRAKAQAAVDKLRRLNPDVRVSAQVMAVGPTLAPTLAANADVVIDAADSFAASYILSDACFAARTPLVSASVLGQSGYVGAFCGAAPSLRAVFPELPECAASCVTSGVFGPVVGALGSLQAQVALRCLLDPEPGVAGQMITVDLGAMGFGGFSFLGSPEPEDGPVFIAKQMLRDDDLVVELRDSTEAPDMVTRAARRVSEDAVSQLRPEPGQRVVLCCQTGVRAWQAACVLRAAGAQNLALLAAGACT